MFRTLLLTKTLSLINFSQVPLSLLLDLASILGPLLLLGPILPRILLSEFTENLPTFDIQSPWPTFSKNPVKLL